MTNLQKDILIYTKDYCPYCTRAKDFFKSKSLSYREIDITQDTVLQQQMLAQSNGRKTVPQIFIGGLHIGGWDDLHAMHTSGELENLL
ncbi:MAG: glutaredoxin 3 [Gammaproteobacteria bacterium]